MQSTDRHSHAMHQLTTCSLLAAAWPGLVSGTRYNSNASPDTLMAAVPLLGVAYLSSVHAASAHGSPCPPPRPCLRACDASLHSSCVCDTIH